MRLPPLLALLLLAPLPALAVEDFSGAWVGWICPSGVQRDSGKCSNFVLELHQKDDQLCGAHMFATAGAERLDEGMAPSVLGEIANDVATVVAMSTRVNPPVKVRVELKKSNGMLHWIRMEHPPGDYLLPKSTHMSRSKSKTLFAPVFEQELKAACSSAFVMAAQEAEKRAKEAAAREQAARAAPAAAAPADTASPVQARP
ncbi:hypothetical protein [Noviherbaspirillum denitrificans]|uniref:Uncharacterized protein n=1 Tax=Noviherbaspirillum denitrificans TaxID=1968433 RepID=A0A254TEP6_9BURK|nr:hypothetical protein [Noviherbaspirillum denitrificans]OWW21074.1 hypothetical protein AYR66_17925 [Noviherbaspirillum denitrificans]